MLNTHLHKDFQKFEIIIILLKSEKPKCKVFRSTAVYVRQEISPPLIKHSLSLYMVIVFQLHVYTCYSGLRVK